MTAHELPVSHVTRAKDRTQTVSRIIVRSGLRVVRALALLVVTVLLLPYTIVPVYRAQVVTPFSGTALYNPYASIGSTWQRANFHAHSRAWAGVTSGRGTPAAVHAAYAAAGYDVIGISNYHRIDRGSETGSFIPVYEHGFSIAKTHQLVIGARRITALDFPLWQTANAKQYLLHEMRDTAALTAVVHPYLRQGYGQSELARLGGYDLLEVRSHWNDASAWWDSVLTAGNPVWAIGNDDSHDTAKRNEVGLVWTMISGANAQPASVLSALRRGAMYVVAAPPGAAPVARLRQVTVRGDTVTTEFSHTMSRIEVRTDGGAVQAQVRGSDRITYVVARDDHYARVVAHAGAATLYLNPIVRSSSGIVRPRGVPPVDRLATLFVQAIAGLAWVGVTWMLLRGSLARRRERRSGRGRPVSPPLAQVPRVVLAIAAVFASVTTADAQAPVQASAQGQNASPVVAPPLPFRIGERHEYDIKFGAIGVGSGSLSVMGPDTLRGREVMRLRYEIDGGIPFFRVHDVMESWFDAESRLSLRFTQVLNEGPKHYDRLFDFYPDELLMLERGKPRAATVARPLDDASFIFFVRTLPLEVGQTRSFSRYFRPNANPVTIEVLRRERITVPAGTFNTIVVKPIIRTSGIFSEGGQAELWFSDDPSHTLVQMKAKLSFGTLSLYLRPTRVQR